MKRNIRLILWSILLVGGIGWFFVGCDPQEKTTKTKGEMLPNHVKSAIWQVKNIVYVTDRNGLLYAVTEAGSYSATMTYIPYGKDIIPKSEIHSIDELPD